jgi:hypothetical protein
MIKCQNFRVQSFDKTEIFVNDVALLAIENPPKLPRDQVTLFFVYKTHHREDTSCVFFAWSTYLQSEIRK